MNKTDWLRIVMNTIFLIWSAAFMNYDNIIVKALAFIATIISYNFLLGIGREPDLVYRFEVTDKGDSK